MTGFPPINTKSQLKNYIEKLKFDSSFWLYTKILGGIIGEYLITLVLRKYFFNNTQKVLTIKKNIKNILEKKGIIKRVKWQDRKIFGLIVSDSRLIHMQSVKRVSWIINKENSNNGKNAEEIWVCHEERYINGKYIIIYIWKGTQPH